MFNDLKMLIIKNKEIIKYLIFGILTTLVNILCFYILDKLNIDIYINNTISWIVSVIFAFITNKLYVFESKSLDIKIIFKEGTSFLGARIFSYFVDMGTIYLLFDGLRINKLISKVVSNIIVIIINYIFSKFIFKKKEGSI